MLAPRHIGVIVVAATGCGRKDEPAPARSPDAAVAMRPAPPIDARPPAPADASAVVHDAAPADGGAADPDSEITAVGACARPDAALRATVEQEIRAWIARKLPRYTLHVPDEDEGTRTWPELVFGCVDDDGLVLGVQADLVDRKRPEKRAGYTWTVRRTARGIAQLGSMHGDATVDWMEWSHQTDLDTVALVDLDRDGDREVVMLASTQEGGAMIAHYEILVAFGSKIVESASLEGDVSLEAAEPGRVVFAISDPLDRDDEGRYACLDADADLADCDYQPPPE